MLTHKELAIRYELSTKTLYNWKTTKPKLYGFLVNSDDLNRYYDRYRILNILIQDYIKEKDTVFTIEEILFICQNKFICKDAEDFKTLPSQFLQNNFKALRENESFTITIYEKLKSLNIIQIYTLYNLIDTVNGKSRKSTDIEREDLIGHYFKEFL